MNDLKNNERYKILTSLWIRLISLFMLISLSACKSLDSVNPQPEKILPDFIPVSTYESKEIIESVFLEGNLEIPIYFREISVEQGLSQSVVACIIQDSRGFIWIGTEDGLNRFDGYEFKIYKHDPDDKRSISNNFIYDIYEDSSGMIWIATEMGLNLFDPREEVFIRYLHDAEIKDSLSHNRVSKILESKNGTIWVGTNGGGLNRFEPQTEKFSFYKNIPGDSKSLSDNMVEDLYEDSRGILWIATRNGLNRLDPDNDLIRQYVHIPGDPDSLPSNHISRIIGGEPGGKWLGTADGLLIMMVRDRFYSYPIDPISSLNSQENMIRDLYLDPSGVILIVSQRGGLSVFSPKTAKFHHYPRASEQDDSTAISTAVIKTIFRDQSGVYWVGTEAGGINVFDHTSQRFEHYGHEKENPDSLSSDIVFSMFEDSDGLLWVGTSRGLDCIDRVTGETRHYQHNPRYPSRTLSGYQVSAIQEDLNGNLWVGTDHGLNQYDPKTNQFIPVKLLLTDEKLSRLELNNQFITSIFLDSDGILWMGAIGLGLIRFDPETNHAILFEKDPADPAGLRGDVIMAIYEDNRGYIWVGLLNEGLSRIEDQSGEITHFTSENSSLSDDNVLSIYQDEEEVLWVGTMGGVNRLDPDSEDFVQYREKDGLPNDTVFGILGDQQGSLWLSTSRGLSRFDLENEIFKNYTRYEELKNIEFNSGAYFQSDSGEMFFGGVNGLNVFYPDQIQDNLFVPPVMITSLMQGGSELNTNINAAYIEEISLKWPQNYFEFEFASLSYIQSEQNQYAYKLEGFDKEWNFNGTNHYGKYTNLPGGVYTLQIMGSNNDGTWNTEGAELIVKVTPPLWNTWGFRILAGSLVVLLIAAGYRYRLHNVQESNRKLAALVEERTREMAQRKQVAEGLREILILLNSNKPLQESLEYIVKQADLLVNARWICLFELTESGAELLASSLDEKEIELFCFIKDQSSGVLERFLSYYANLIHETGVIHIENISAFQNANKDLEIPETIDIHQIVILPLMVDGGVFGGMAVNMQDSSVLTQETLDLLNALVEQASLALGNAILREQAEELAVLSERNRLARDLHDAVTQTLFSASLIAEALPNLWLQDPDDGHQLLHELRLMNRSALSEMRTLLLELRPTAIIDSKLSDLLKQLTEAITGKTKMAVDLDIDAIYNLPDEVHLGFYRIAQETLNNIVKHADARQIELHFHSMLQNKKVSTTKEARFVLKIADDGCGFNIDDVDQAGFGLQNVQERALLIGADLEISSKPGNGTRVTTVWQGEVKNNDDF
ncbi:MAG: hypothetical protein JEZ06_04970 [Anaerolineaceae bacterium]|nr:hypothetical protein [Anaerolineaceae bacterium]